MKNKTLLISACLVVTLSACNDDYSKQFDMDNGITDVKNLTLTLQSTDYATIASNSTNQAIALAKDPEGNTYVEALNAVGKNKYFTSMAPAEDYLPAYVGNLYPNADNGSKAIVTYKTFKGSSNYLKDFANISAYTLSSDDYEGVWGSKVKASYLSPTTTSKIPGILAGAISSPAEGDMVVVNYAYSATEPSIGGGSSTAEPTWTEIVDGGVWSNGSNWNYVNTGGFDLSAYAGQKINFAIQYLSTDAVAPTLEIKNFRVQTGYYNDVCIFKKGETNYAKVTSFSGAGDYVIAGVSTDGKYYPFGKAKTESATYGYIYSSPITVTDDAISLADGADQNITVEASGDNFTMKNAWGKYIYMSGTYDSFNFAAEKPEAGAEWTVTSMNNGQFAISNVSNSKTIKINLYNGSFSIGCYAETKWSKPVIASYPLTGDDDPTGGFTTIDKDLAGLSYVWKSDSKYGWKASAYSNKVSYATDSWLVSPVIDLSDATNAYVDFDCAINNLKGNTRTDYMKMWVSTDYSSSTRATRASVQATNAALYVYNGSEWQAYSNSNANVAVVEPSVYSSLGSSTLSNPDATLPSYLSSKYPYASVEDRAVVVYMASSGAAVADYELTTSGWEKASETAMETVTLSKEEGVWSASMSTYMDASLLGDEAGFVADNVSLDGLTYVWTNTSSYGWKASGYSGSAKNADSYLVSPVLNFKKATEPMISFDDCVNYLSGKQVEDYLTVLISSNYTGDASTATWTELKFENRGDGSSWNFVNTGWLSLKDYVGSSVVIAFRYVSDGTIAPTWEFKNIKIMEASSISK